MWKKYERNSKQRTRSDPGCFSFHGNPPRVFIMSLCFNAFPGSLSIFIVPWFIIFNYANGSFESCISKKKFDAPLDNASFSGRLYVLLFHPSCVKWTQWHSPPWKLIKFKWDINLAWSVCSLILYRHVCVLYGKSAVRITTILRP